MTWRQDRMRSCQATGNNNPGISFSAIAKRNYCLFAGPAALIKTPGGIFLETSESSSIGL
jgi:hypothetical protein